MGIYQVMGKEKEKQNKNEALSDLRQISWTITMLICIFIVGELTVKYYLPRELDHFLHMGITVPWCMEGLLVLIFLFSKRGTKYQRTFFIMAGIAFPLLIILSIGVFFIYALGSGPFR